MLNCIFSCIYFIFSTFIKINLTFPSDQSLCITDILFLIRYFGLQEVPLFSADSSMFYTILPAKQGARGEFHHIAGLSAQVSRRSPTSWPDIRHHSLKGFAKNVWSKNKGNRGRFVQGHFIFVCFAKITSWHFNLTLAFKQWKNVFTLC